MEHKNFDSLLATLGFGRWTLFMFASYFGWALLLPYFSLGGAFYNPTVDHWCHVAELDNSTWTLEERLNYSVPWEERGGRLQRSQCLVYERDYSQVAGEPWTPALAVTPAQAARLPTRPCHTWTYDTSTFTSTVTTEWDLVCGMASLSPFFQSFYFFGTAVGEPLLGFLADRFGRRWVVSGAAVVFAATSLGSVFAPVYWLVLAARFILGVLHPIIGPAYIQGLESCPPSLRTAMGLLSTVPFAVTGMFFGTWAYFLREWRTLQLVCTVPAILLLIQIPFMNESPRWLMLQGRYRQAAKVLERAGRWQGVELPPRHQLVALLEKFRLENVEESGQGSAGRVYEEGGRKTCGGRVRSWGRDATVLVQTPTLRRITLGLFGCWFCTGLTYWGISLSGTTFSTDPFLYMVLSSLFEIPGYSGFLPMVTRFGRRSVLAFNFFVCSACILTILATPANYTWMVFSLALAGKLFITGSYGLLYLISSELFPTSVRSRGLNVSSMMARLGSILSPFIIKILAETYWWTPSVLFGLCAGLGSVFALVLPESRNKPLPDTVQQLELIYNSSRSSSSSSIEGKGAKGAAEPLAPEAAYCEEAAGV